MKLRSLCAGFAPASFSSLWLAGLATCALFLATPAGSAMALPTDGGGVGGGGVGGGGVGGNPISALSSEAIGTLPGYWVEDSDYPVLSKLGSKAWIQYISLSTTVILPTQLVEEAVLSAVGDGFVLLNLVGNQDRVRLRFYGNVRLSFQREVLAASQTSLASTIGFLYGKAPAHFSWGERDGVPVRLPATGQTVTLWSSKWQTRETKARPKFVLLEADSCKGFKASQFILPLSEVVWAYQHVL